MSIVFSENATFNAAVASSVERLQAALAAASTQAQKNDAHAAHFRRCITASQAAGGASVGFYIAALREIGAAP